MTRSSALFLALAAACTHGDATTTATSDIINGTPASPAERPWAAFLSIQLQNGNSTVCSGALVAPNKVLTAAHCAVCASSISVTMLGAAASHSASSWAVAPGAFPVAPQCAFQSLQSELEAKINIGADLAVVTLSSSSAVAPIPALVAPPFGWDPVTETSGGGISGVTILGRGPSSLGGGDVSTMREGDANLDALTATAKAGCPVPAPSTLPFLQLWNSGSQATMVPGDSGGPMIATFWGAPKVIGAASWFCEDDVSYYAPVFAAETAPFVAGQLGLFAGGDGDGDHVLDSADNCPGIANPNQKDSDDDHVGNVCDDCPQVADPDQANCNAEAEHALGATARGDACDPTPCAGVALRWGQVPDALVPAPFALCAVNGWAFATCHWEMPVGFDVTPVAQAGAAPVPGKIGLRHCRCDAPHDTPEQREASCRSPASWSCDVDGALYPAGGPEWRSLAVTGAGADPLTTVAFAPAPGPVVAIGWDSAADLAALGTGSLPPPPWSPDADGVVAGVRLDGIVWAHVVERDGTATSAMGSLGGVPYVDLAGSYAAADHRFRKVYHWHELPQYAPAWPWTYCARCGELELPWVVVIDPERRVVVGVGPDGARELALGADVLELLARGRVVPAAEPAGLLERAGIARRALVIDAGGAPIGALRASREGDGVAAAALRGSPLRGTDTARLFAYSALRDEAYAVRLASGASRAELERAAGVGAAGAAGLVTTLAGAAGWRRVAIGGAELGFPLAAALHADDNALYLVDRVGASTRLVRIDLIAERATVIAPRLLSAGPRAVALSITARGELLLAVGFAERSELAWIAGGRLVGRASARSELAGDARELRRGVHFAARAGDRFAPAFVPANDRRAPGAGEGLSPVF